MDYFAAEKTVVSIEGGNVPGTLVVSYPLPETAPLVSLIVPTRDGGKVLRSCLESIRGKTGYPNYEIVVVDNQSRDTATCDYLASLAGAGVVRLLHYDKPFNYSAINNFAVSQARGEIVGLLNDDLEVISPDWLTEMVRHALRPEIGAVGAMLYYPDRRIQHAGVILGLRGVAGHIGHGLLPEQVNYPERLGLVQNYSAVTAACLLVRKAVYQQIGGLDEQSLPVAYNDVDFCLRLGAAGYRNLWTPLAELYHHESVSRGYDETSDKKERWQRESLYMQKQWGRMINSDPCYNPNLTLAWPDCRVACPPRTAKPWVE
jgi:GT2 family glycosyltransferase